MKKRPDPPAEIDENLTLEVALLSTMIQLRDEIRELRYDLLDWRSNAPNTPNRILTDAERTENFNKLKYRVSRHPGEILNIDRIVGATKVKVGPRSTGNKSNH